METLAVVRPDFSEMSIDRAPSRLGEVRSFTGGVAAARRSAGSVGSLQGTAGIMQKDWVKFRDNFLPMIDKLTKFDNGLVERAEKDTANLAEQSRQQIAQVNGRRLSKLSPAQQRMLSQNINAGAAGTASAVISDAALRQRDILDAGRMTAYGFANDIANQGIGLMSQAEGLKANREAQNKANKKSFMSSALGMVGTVTGGIMGGPLGASIGGALGSAVGGGI